ncbi:MAG: gluconate 2-dehydrogenase subunit 3 family protein [Bryobacteraceae bacterium]
MKRRSMLQSVLGASAASALAGPAAAQEKAPPAVEESVPLTLTAPDGAADGVPHFFDRAGLAALARLGEILIPAQPAAPGAKEAEAALFLDFLIGQSPADRQSLYRNGVARLNQEAQKRHAQPFSTLSAAQAEPILSTLREAWTYAGPSDPFARFLLAAKDDFLQATVNSRQWADAGSRRRRSAGGASYYYLPIE